MKAELSTECPLCKSHDMRYFQSPRNGQWKCVCVACVGEDAISFYSARHGVTMHFRPPDAEPLVKHSAVGEPTTVNDLLYDVLGYYS